MSTFDLLAKRTHTVRIANDAMLLFFLTLLCVMPVHAESYGDSFNEAEDFVLEIDDSEELLIEEQDTPSPALEAQPLVEDQEVITIEEELDSADEKLSIEFDEPILESPDDVETTALQATPVSDGSVKIDEIWMEYAAIPDSNSRASGQGYLHSSITANWMPSDNWEFELSGRLDGYFQFGNPHLDDTRLDYDESFVRYRNNNLRFTLGAQKVLWGRIDELPPTDRLSTPDFSRYILDELSDRRRANPAVRLEQFFDKAKLDLVFLPLFREAELPDKDSIWYPVDRSSGKILGLKPSAATTAVIKSAEIDDDAPDSDGGFGIRYSRQSGGLDYAMTVQKVRQATPYFAFDTTTGVLQANYPRSWLVGGDFGFEALNATWRFEAAWSSDTPVTRKSGAYTTTESLSWGGGMEFYPGDGDARLTLQLTGSNLINSPAVQDRDEIYMFNGEFEVPFGENQWLAKARFYIGLDERDIYFNPEISYTGWESQKLYLTGHYFNGAAGTPGGFHQDNSLIALGWRVVF